MKKKALLATLAGGSVVAGQCLARRYRLDRDAAYARLDAIDRTTVMTRFGTLEYSERVSGEPLLAVHGFFGGCDEALLSLGGLAADRRVIAPSRFGYLGSGMPAGATVAGQADAFAALLDELGLGALDVIAISSCPAASRAGEASGRDLGQHAWRRGGRRPALSRGWYSGMCPCGR